METLIVEQPAKKFPSFYDPPVWIITEVEKHQNSSCRELDLAHSLIHIRCPSKGSFTHLPYTIHLWHYPFSLSCTD
jgi:hypothetical protein